jgi:signal transduction histidine kinase
VGLAALVALLLLFLSIGELSDTLEASRQLGIPSGAVRYLRNLQLGILVAITFGISATLVAVRWLTAATNRLGVAHNEIAKVTHQLHEEEASERLLQDRLVKAARQWAVTFDAIDAVIAVVDEEGRLLRLNRYAADLLGGRPPDFVGLPITRWARSEPWHRMTELLDRPLAMSPSERRDEADGRYWVISASFDHELGGTVFLARDGTDMIEMRAQLERRRRGDEMGTFVAGVAHEVRNPLFAITANLQALQEETDKAAVFDEYFGWIQSSAIRLQVLMQDLLDYARPASARLAEGSLPEVIARSVAACVEPARRAGIDVQVECAADLPDLRMDPQQIEQVFRNLIENAVALSPAETTVRISAHHDATAGAVCTVEDAGPGFSPEEQERGFEPFFTRRKGGTGLGLAVVRRIMDGHGGFVDLGNREGGGARVRLVFPLRLADSFTGSDEP